MPAGPATRRLARELGIDLRPGRRHRPQPAASSKRTSKAYVRQLAAVRGRLAAPGRRPCQAPPLPKFEEWARSSASRMLAVRKATARQMSLAWSQIPHVTQHDRRT